jgi:hypothetical protein
VCSPPPPPRSFVEHCAPVRCASPMICCAYHRPIAETAIGLSRLMEQFVQLLYLRADRRQYQVNIALASWLKTPVSAWRAAGVSRRMLA